MELEAFTFDMVLRFDKFFISNFHCIVTVYQEFYHQHQLFGISDTS